MSKSTKEVGAELENLILSYLKEIDSKARLTKGSGCSTQKGDILNNLGLKIEAKLRNTENAIIQRKWWKKLCGECISYNNDVPILILQNKHKEVYCVLDIKDLMELLKLRRNNA